MRGIAFGLVALGLTSLLAAQDSTYFVPADRVTVRAMRSVPPIDLAPGVRVHTVVGPTGSVSLGEFDKGGTTPAHHHTREQVDVGLSGVIDMTLGNHTEPLGPGAGVIIPADVNHSLTNAHEGIATVIEFHTVPRPDLVPPRPSMTFPVGANAVAVADGHKFVRQLATGTLATAAGKIDGATCVLVWQVLKGSASVDVHSAPTRAEWFVYVARGDGELSASGQSQRMGTDSLIVIPADARHVTLKAGVAGADLVEFSPGR